MMRRLPDAFNISLRTGASDGLTCPSATVVLWPKKKCPVIVRRLARTSPYPGEAVGPAGVAMLSDRFYYAVPGTGSMFDVAFKKVAAIHKVVGDL